MNKIIEWLNHRTGLDQTMHDALYENIPGGARWRYVSGSMLVFAFVTQVVTGLFLWMSYSPSSQTAWESVYYIQHEMTGGWLLRGIHHFMAQAMVVLLGVHLLQVVWDGAYKAPREVNYWLGLILMQIVMGLGLTGYLLPWDQKGYWATNVATNLMTLVPFAGKDIQQLVLGGSDYGHHTLTRFFALHAGVLPATLIVFLAMHIAVFRRHGITAHPRPGRADEYFWPNQVLLDAIACLVLLGVVGMATIHFDVQGLFGGALPAEHRGAELGAPADPSEQYSAARPEWYFLFLFQLLKYFHGESEWIGALAIPGAIMVILALMPFIGRKKWGHAFNVVFVIGLLVGAGVLTLIAKRDDSFHLVADTWKFDVKEGDDRIKMENSAREFHQAQEDAERESARMIELVGRQTLKDDGELSDRMMIPRQGAVYLLRNDPLTQGPKLFARHCASCHDYYDATEKDTRWHFANQMQSPKVSPGTNEVLRDEKGKVVYDDTPNGAPNLYGFASRPWIAGLLNADNFDKISYGQPVPSKDKDIADQANHPENFKRPITAPYFGNSAHRMGRMVDFVKKHLKKEKPKIPPKDVEDIVMALSAQAELSSQAEDEGKDASRITHGVELIKLKCTGCHRFGDAGELAIAPDLTGYGSYEWMMGFVSDPTHSRFYRRENDRMPSFAKDLEHPQTHSVSVRELSLIVDWIRGQYYEARAAKPELPHGEEVARRTTELARMTTLPLRSTFGAQAGALPKPSERAAALFGQNCSVCHSYVDPQGRGIATRKPTAPNLLNFGSRAWIGGFLDPKRIATEEYFGGTTHVAGEMVGFVHEKLANLDDAKKAELTALIAALSAEAGLPKQKADDEAAKTDGTLEKGRKALVETFACIDCHKFGEEGDIGAPDLTGYASLEWLKAFISNPEHERFYGDANDRMPDFNIAARGRRNLLDADEIELLAKWLRGEDVDAPPETPAAK
jgi:quinol-cytochrome oxidoreductase complex cytochrome b subunit/mono/diheme cytochrome c family protein